MTFENWVFNNFEEFIKIFKIITDITIFFCIIYIKCSLRIVNSGRVTYVTYTKICSAAVLIFDRTERFAKN